MAKKSKREARQKAKWQQREREVARRAKEDQDGDPSPLGDLHVQVSSQMSEAMSQLGTSLDEFADSMAELSRAEKIDSLEDEVHRLRGWVHVLAACYQRVAGERAWVGFEELDSAKAQGFFVEFEHDPIRLGVTVKIKEDPPEPNPIFDW